MSVRICLVFVFLINLKTSSSSIDGSEKTRKSMFKAVYWQVKPYCYSDEDGSMIGVLPELLKLVNFHCNKYTHRYDQFIEYAAKTLEVTELVSLFHGDTPYGQGALQNLSAANTLWFPYFKLVEAGDFKDFYRRNATQMQLTAIDRVVIIKQSWRISLEYKFIVGLFHCRVFFAYIVCQTVTVSVLTWLLERNRNPDISESLVCGIGDSYWMLMVTLVTVGYGDVCPKSAITKLIMVFWMFSGLFYSAMLTATVLESMNTSNVNSLKNERIAVINNSFEKHYVEKNFHPKHLVSTVSNYQAVMKVRAGDVDVAVVNSHVASYYQHEILEHDYHNGLSMVEEMPIYIPLYIVHSNHTHPEAEALWKCISEHRESIVASSFNKYERLVPIVKTRVVNFAEAAHLHPYQVTAALALASLLIGLCIEYRRRIFLVCKNPKSKIDVQGTGTELT